MRLLRKLIQKFFALFALTVLASAIAPASEAHAFMYRGGYATAGFSGGALSPFVGMPFYPGGGSMMMTGQMNGGVPYDPTMMMLSNNFNWSGAQPMGYSYMPPIGLNAISNNMRYSQSIPQLNNYMNYSSGGFGGWNTGFGGQSFGGAGRAF